MSADALIAVILEREGGYVDHPADRGGPTNFGITQATLAAHRGGPVTADDVRGMSREEAVAIYRKQYVAPFARAVGNLVLLDLCVDCAVNHGVSRAAKWLQSAVNATPDGKIGPQTQACVRGADPRETYCRILATRVSFYGRLITQDRTQAAFAHGWMNRAAAFIERMPEV